MHLYVRNQVCAFLFSDLGTIQFELLFVIEIITNIKNKQFKPKSPYERVVCVLLLEDKSTLQRLQISFHFLYSQCTGMGEGHMVPCYYITLSYYTETLVLHH